MRSIGMDVHRSFAQVAIHEDGITAKSFGLELEHDAVVAFGKAIYDPLHCIPVLARKPGALRNGPPFKEWEMPPAMRRVQHRLGRVPDGDRQMVDIPGAALTDGLDAVEDACAEALSEGVHSAAVILNILARRREPPPPLTIATPEALRLVVRYDPDERVHSVEIFGKLAAMLAGADKKTPPFSRRRRVR